MAKGLIDLNAKLELLEQELLKAGPKLAQEIAVNALALSVNRIQTEGVEGKQYSIKPMLATVSMFNKKSAFKPTVKEQKEGEKKKPKKKRWVWIKFPKAKKAVPVMILPGGYKELRKLNGLQTAHVDLTFSGRMLQNTKLLKFKERGAQFIYFIGASDKEEKVKLAGNNKKYGDFLAPTKEDIPVLQEVNVDAIEKIFKQVLG